MFRFWSPELKLFRDLKTRIISFTFFASAVISIYWLTLIPLNCSVALRFRPLEIYRKRKTVISQSTEPTKKRRDDSDA